MAKQPASSIRITKTRSGGTKVRATGNAAQALFDAMCKAHGLQNPMKPARQAGDETPASNDAPTPPAA